MNITLRFQYLGLLILLIVFVGVTPEHLEAMQHQQEYTWVKAPEITMSYLQDRFYKAELNREIDINLKNETLKQALRTVAQKTGLKLTYRGEITNDKRVTLHAPKISVDDALTFILESTDLEHMISQDGYLLIAHAEEDLNIVAVQPETVRGQVTDGQTDEPLPGVNILVKGTNTGTSTDNEGNFELAVSFPE